MYLVSANGTEEKVENNEATNKKSHIEDRMPESSLAGCWGMGLDTFLQWQMENIPTSKWCL